jgi:prepilin-type N-terminal cleavage/methylation domain-containing protein
MQVIDRARQRSTRPGGTRRGAAPGRARVAFTLIELLVVVAVLSILMLLTWTGLRSALDRARRAHCASNLHQLLTPFAAYADDHQGRVPFGNLGGMGWDGYELNRACPTGVQFGILWVAGYLEEGQLGILFCPAMKDPRWLPRSAQNGGAVGAPARAGYTTRPEVTWSGGNGCGQVVPAFDCAEALPGWMRLSDYTSRAILSDVVGVPLVHSPVGSPTVHENGLNVMYGNAAVRWVKRPFIEADLQRALTSGQSDLSAYIDPCGAVTRGLWGDFDHAPP